MGFSLGYTIERGFRFLDLFLRIHRLAGIQRAFDEGPPDTDQFAQQRQIVDLVGEVAGTDQAGAVAGQFGQIGRATQCLHRLVRLEIGFQGHRSDHHILVEQLQRLFVDPAVQWLVKMFRPQTDLHIFRDAVVDQQRAKKGRLCLDIARQALSFTLIILKTHQFGHGSSFTLNRFSARGPAKKLIKSGDSPVDKILPRAALQKPLS